MATSTDVKRPSPTPLTAEQRRRVECLSFVRMLYGPSNYGGGADLALLPLDDVLRLTDYLVTGKGT